MTIPVSLQQTVKEGVEVVQGEAGVHAPVLLNVWAGFWLDIVILSSRQILCILTNN